MMIDPSTLEPVVQSSGLAVADGIASSLEIAKAAAWLPEACLDGKFKFSEQGCEPSGTVITKADLQKGVAMLSNAIEEAKTGRINSSMMWALGDMIVMLEDNYENAEDLIHEAVAVTGHAKDAVMIATRVSRRWLKADRIPGLSHTHHRELLAFPEVDSVKRDEIIRRVLEEGEILSSVTTVGGEHKLLRKPKSCAEMRLMLREAAGRVEEKQDEEPVYLYVTWSGKRCEPRWSVALDSALAVQPGVTTIHLATMQEINLTDFKPAYKIPQEEPPHD